MIDDDREFPDLDPAKLLPFTVQFQPDEPSAIKLPRRYYIGDRFIPRPVDSEDLHDD